MLHRLGGASAYRSCRPLLGAGVDLCSSRGMATTPSSGSDIVRFAQFDVTDQVFLRTEHVVGIVNLKPIVPFRELLKLQRLLTPCSDC